MKSFCPLFLLIASLVVLTACSSSTNSSGAPKPAASPAFDAEEIEQDLKTGKIKFEIRGLTNEAQETSYGGKSYLHSAIVIPVGDSKYLKGDYLLMCSMRRLSGGDPERPRKGEMHETGLEHEPCNG